MAERLYTAIYDESNAELISEVALPNTNKWTSVRFWKKNVPPKERQNVIREMDLYISSKNANPQKYVMFPSVSDKGSSDPKGALHGMWRLVKNEIDPADRNEKGIYQTLEKYYLQPPGTANDYPSSKDANDWSGIDSLTRVIEVSEYEQANRILGGKNLVYGATIPNVATDTVKEFCAALANRGPMANPVFEGQHQLAGTFKYGGVTSKMQDDGSSTVYATLAHSDSFQNASLTFSALWNETVARMFWDGLPDYPAAFPPVTIPAVDNGDFTAQITNATIYQIMDAKLDDKDGLWHIVVNKRTAIPYFQSWDVSSVTGTYRIYEYMNQTAAWVKNFLATLPSGLNNECFRPPHHNEFNLFEGNLHSRPKSSTSADFVNQGPLTEVMIQLIPDRLGNFYQFTYTATYYLGVNNGVGINGGLTNYNANNPIDFKDGSVEFKSAFVIEGNGQFRYKAYTQVDVHKVTLAPGVFYTTDYTYTHP